MIKILLARLRQGGRTTRYPAGPPPPLPDRFRGRPTIDGALCDGDCRACADACPTGALARGRKGIEIDLGACLFCPECASACPRSALSYASDHRLATGAREDLVVPAAGGERRLATAMGRRLKGLLGRSLKLRQVSAGGCNACEADVNVLGTIGWDLGRFGIQMVASPRHADGLLVTGPVTKNMELALKKTYEAVPGPKIVIAVGSCAISGGPYAGSPEALGGAGSLLPVDLFVPGCPPHPLTILDGLLRLIGRIRAP